MITFLSRFGARLGAVFILSAALAQAQTVFSLTSTAANYETGAAVANSIPNSGIASVGSTFSSTGPVNGGVTGFTFGQSFRVGTNGTNTQPGTAAWLYDGNHAGDTVASGTVLPIGYNFTVAKNLLISSNVTWTLYFRDGGSSDVAVASGVLNSASATFIGTANYTYTSTVSAPATFRAYLDVSFTNNLAVGQGFVDVTMTNTGFDGGGITLGTAAIPEPSTYAMIFGAVGLAAAVWRRRTQATRA